MNYAVILAGGIGSRFNINIPKQFIKLKDEEILIHTIKEFEQNKNIDKILIVMNPEWLAYTNKLIKKYSFKKILGTIKGGKTRPESSYNSISYLDEIVKDDDIILIHDAVRPFITDKIINECLINVKKYGACCVAVKSTDTIIKVTDNMIADIPNRKSIYNEQTPQVFRFWLIKEAIQKLKETDFHKVTDDVSFVHKLGKPIYIVEGDYDNIKITTSKDLYIAEKILEERFGDTV
jgi:2-C-methyl-D-erythritol 4-phosphate cytidylyltransferase